MASKLTFFKVFFAINRWIFRCLAEKVANCGRVRGARAGRARGRFGRIQLRAARMKWTSLTHERSTFIFAITFRLLCHFICANSSFHVLNRNCYFFNQPICHHFVDTILGCSASFNILQHLTSKFVKPSISIASPSFNPAILLPPLSTRTW